MSTMKTEVVVIRLTKQEASCIRFNKNDAITLQIG